MLEEIVAEMKASAGKIDFVKGMTPDCNTKQIAIGDGLYEFANKIGMRREWFQDKKLPHYDLTAKRRQLALSKGAVEVDSSWVKQRLRDTKG